MQYIHIHSPHCLQQAANLCTCEQPLYVSTYLYSYKLTLHATVSLNYYVQGVIYIDMTGSLKHQTRHPKMALHSKHSNGLDCLLGIQNVFSFDSNAFPPTWAPELEAKYYIKCSKWCNTRDTCFLFLVLTWRSPTITRLPISIVNNYPIPDVHVGKQY